MVVCICRDLGCDTGVPKEVQCEDGLQYKAVPCFDGKQAVPTRKNGYEMALESLHGTFYIVTLMYVWWGEFNGAAIATHSSF